MASELTIFERRAIRMLIGGALESSIVEKIMNDATPVNPVFDSGGYTIETTILQLPLFSDQFELPIVLGRYLDIEVRFTAEYVGQVLRLICRTLESGVVLDEGFRTQEVMVESCDHGS